MLIFLIFFCIPCKINGLQTSELSKIITFSRFDTSLTPVFIFWWKKGRVSYCFPTTNYTSFRSFFERIHCLVCFLTCLIYSLVSLLSSLVRFLSSWCVAWFVFKNPALIIQSPISVKFNLSCNVRINLRSAKNYGY